MIARANIYWTKNMQSFLWVWKLVWLYYTMKAWGSRLLMKLNVPKSVRQFFAITSRFKMANRICVICFCIQDCEINIFGLWTRESKDCRPFLAPRSVWQACALGKFLMSSTFGLAGTFSCHVSFSTMKSLFGLYRSASGCFSMRSTHAGLMLRQPRFRSARTSCRTFDFSVHPSRNNFSWVHRWAVTLPPCLRDP